jgi:hypothetical protein
VHGDVLNDDHKKDYPHNPQVVNGVTPRIADDGDHAGNNNGENPDRGVLDSEQEDGHKEPDVLPLVDPQETLYWVKGMLIKL